MHGELEQVSPPRRIHDRQRADDQHAANEPGLHKIVSSPNHRASLAGALLVEAERPSVHRKERSGGSLVFKRAMLPRPVVASEDRRGDVANAQVAQDLRFLHAPMHHHPIAGKFLAFGDHGRDLLGVADLQQQRLVFDDFHSVSADG